jgi:hypothetical protein
LLVEELFSYYINDLLPTCRNVTANVTSKVTVSMDLSIRGVLDVVSGIIGTSVG